MSEWERRMEDSACQISHLHRVESGVCSASSAPRSMSSSSSGQDANHHPILGAGLLPPRDMRRRVMFCFGAQCRVSSSLLHQTQRVKAGKNCGSWVEPRSPDTRISRCSATHRTKEAGVASTCGWHPVELPTDHPGLARRHFLQQK